MLKDSTHSLQNAKHDQSRAREGGRSSLHLLHSMQGLMLNKAQYPLLPEQVGVYPHLCSTQLSQVFSLKGCI